MTPEQSNICDALEKHLGSYLSKEASAVIRRDYGDVVLAGAEKVYREAIHCPVDWRTATMDTALAALSALLTERHPWLTAKARSSLVHAFIMAWK
jgi:hypothetical protein